MVNINNDIDFISVQRRYEADYVELHAEHLRGGDELPAEPESDAAAILQLVSLNLTDRRSKSSYQLDYG